MSKEIPKFAVVETFFKALQIDTNSPGFYNDPTFIEAEKNNPNLLDYYAVFVDGKEYSDAYLESSAKTILKVAEFLSNELLNDGRLGACVDISGYMVKILEEFGIWSYCATGATKIVFEKKLNLETTYFWPYNSKRSVGHQWVVAPPYFVVDLTIKFQAYNKNQSQHIPNFLAIKNLKSITLKFSDLVEPEIRNAFPRPHTIENLMIRDPMPILRMENLKSTGEVVLENCKIHYGCLATKFLEEKSIKDCSNAGYKPNGKNPRQLFEEIKDKLNN